MSVNINIQVPFEIVAAIKAATSSKESSVVVHAAINCAVIDAIKALPYDIRASKSPTTPPNAPVTSSSNVSGPSLEAMESLAIPFPENLDELTSTATIKIMVRNMDRVVVSALERTPDTTLAKLRRQFWIPSPTPGPEYVLMHKGRQIYAMDYSIAAHEDGLTLQMVSIATSRKLVGY